MIILHFCTHSEVNLGTLSDKTYRSVKAEGRGGVVPKKMTRGRGFVLKF